MGKIQKGNTVKDPLLFHEAAEAVRESFERFRVCQRRVTEQSFPLWLLLLSPPSTSTIPSRWCRPGRKGACGLHLARMAYIRRGLCDQHSERVKSCST